MRVGGIRKKEEEEDVNRSYPLDRRYFFWAVSLVCRSWLTSLVAEKEGNGQKGRVAREEQELLNAETERKSSKGLFVGVQDDLPSTESSRKDDTNDGLEDIWREMTLAYEWSKNEEGKIKTTTRLSFF